MDFSQLDILDEFFGMGDDSNPLMMLVWILPIILLVFYGQRLQLIITSRDIKKELTRLEQFRNDSRNDLINSYIKFIKWYWWLCQNRMRYFDFPTDQQNQ